MLAICIQNGRQNTKSSYLEERERGVEVQNWPHVLLKNNA
jgi:hypothetical protein